jgi:hypothetical protein
MSNGGSDRSSVGDSYPILTIQPEWVLEEEAMGSKQKFWFRQTNDGADSLFKYPQPNTGQHWAEKIAAEIAKELNILHAKVDLALFDGIKGSATESFAREGYELYHGNQVLAGQVLGYNPAKKFRQSSHTLSNIFAALDRVFRRPEAAIAAKRSVAEYLVLDALIGNTDRHHENWGILVKGTPTRRTVIIAPSFDHASSLGRELLDDTAGKCRMRILKEGRIGRYAENAPGAVYWDESDRLSPLELTRRAARLYPDLFRPAFASLGKLEKESLERIVQRVPADWMSEAARQFAIELTCYNLKQLREMAA